MEYFQLNAGAYQASSEGAAMGIVNGTIEAAYAWIGGSCGPATAVATGGLFGSSTPGEVLPVGNSFLLPVPAGQIFSLTANVFAGQPATPAIQFFWIGTDAPTAVDAK
jgi:hypothetical protein